MKVRCTCILESGRAGGRVIENSTSVHVGGDYVVLELSAHRDGGVSYMVLEDNSATGTAVLTSEMFEITGRSLSPTWRAWDPYGTGKLIVFEPEMWLIDEFWDRKNAGEREAFAAFVRGVAQLYEEEGEPLPPEFAAVRERGRGQ